MMKVNKRGYLLLVSVALFGVERGYSVDDTWEGPGTDLNTPANWVGNSVPDGVATFDSNLLGVELSPTATTPFTVDTMNFSNSASLFEFTFTQTVGNFGVLNITGSGITGTNTNTSFLFTNSTTLNTPQMLFDTGSTSIDSSIGSATLNAVNSLGARISHVGQIVISDIYSGPTGTVTADDNATIIVTNYGEVSTNSTSTAQLLVNDTAFNTGESFSFSALNSGTSALISAEEAGQMAFVASGNTSTFTSGNNASFLFINEDQATVYSDYLAAGQLVVNCGDDGLATFTTIDGATFDCFNRSGAILESDGESVGQVMIEGGDSGSSSLTVLDGATFNLTNNNANIRSSYGIVGNLSVEAYLGSASFSAGNDLMMTLVNENDSIIYSTFWNVGQLTMDGWLGSSTFTAGDNATINITNDESLIHSKDAYEVGQLVLEGFFGSEELTVGNNATFNLVNNGGFIHSENSWNAGQVVLNCERGTTTFTVGNNATFNITNDNSTLLVEDGRNATQMVFDGNDGTTSFSALDFLSLKVINRNGSTLSTINSSLSGQVVFDADAGASTFSAEDNALITISNESGSTISSATWDVGQFLFWGLNGSVIGELGDDAEFSIINDGATMTSSAHDSGQFLFDASNGSTSISLGERALITIANTNGGNIVSSASNGNVGQFVFDAFGGDASFTALDSFILNLTNKEGSTIANDGNRSTGQLVFDANGGTSSMDFGSNSTIHATNSSEISSTNASSRFLSQILFDTSSLTTGDNVNIMATNTVSGTLVNPLIINPVSQIYFFDTPVVGNPTITAINQELSPSIEGIVFQGATTADDVNIVLENSSLVVLTDSTLTIASLTGDDSSLTKMDGESLRINTVLGSDTLFSGVISGANRLYIDGLGAQTLTGVNTYTVGTTLQGGTLRIVRDESLGAIGTDVTIDGAATLGALGAIESERTVHLFDALTVDTNGYDVTWNGVLMETGSLIKIGSGTLNLSNTNIFSGGTQVEAGTFHLGSTGSVSSDVVVNGGTITGTGTVGGNLNINPGANVSPGDSIGILNVIGNYTQESGSTYLVEFDGTGQSDLINISDTATLSGGNVNAISLDGEALKNVLYQIVTATNGVSGEFDSISVSNVNLLLTPSLVYDANNVYFRLSRIDFDFATVTSNQIAVANQLESCDDPTLAEFTFLSTLNNLPASEQQAVLNQLTGQQYTSLIFSLELASDRFLKNLYTPIRSIVTTEPTCCCSYDSLINVWFNLSPGQSFIDGCENTEGMDLNSISFCLGIEKIFCQNLTVGTSLFYNQDNVNYKVGGDGRNRTLFGALYGVYRPLNFYILGDIGFGGGKFNVSRLIEVDGDKYQAKGSPSLYEGFAYLEGGFDLIFPCLLVQPFFGIKGAFYQQSQFEEYGHTIFNLDVASIHDNNGYSRLGFHVTASPLCSFTLSLDIDWKYRFSHTENSVEESFVSFCNLQDDFKIRGLPNKQNSIGIGGSVRYCLMEYLELFGEVNSELWHNLAQYNIILGVKASW
ncbi:autotransporter-associated beta strand repeat-containing protein [Chlamydiales bacterium]|nr:autotransporter-associated beta strand repeat-containing protein [Chlamydiales bacterium]